jgi:hypothetical protein
VIYCRVDCSYYIYPISILLFGLGGRRPCSGLSFHSRSPTICLNENLENLYISAKERKRSERDSVQFPYLSAYERQVVCNRRALQMYNNNNNNNNNNNIGKPGPIDPMTSHITKDATLCTT